MTLDADIMRKYALFVNSFRSSITGITSLNADDKAAYFAMMDDIAALA